MQALFLIPTLLYGVMTFFNGGSPMFLVVSVVTVLIWLLIGSQRELDLSKAVRFDGDRVYQGERRLSLFPWLWGAKVRNKVYATAFEVDPLVKLATLGESHIGVTAQGDFLSQPISAAVAHGLVIGPTGSGKTELAKIIADRFEGEVWAVDFKGGSGFAKHPKVRKILTNLEQSDPLELLNELRRRESGEYFDPLLVVIDELGELIRSAKWLSAIETIAAKGRSFQMHLLLCNQTLGQIPRTIWGNCAFRAGIAADQIDLAQLGIKGESKTSHGHGFALCSVNGTQVGFWFPFGSIKQKTAPALAEAVNPLIRFDSRPQSEPFVEFAQSHQSPSDPWSAEEQPEPQDLLGHPHDSRGQHRIERYSRTL